jgi:hypothetical protein
MTLAWHGRRNALPSVLATSPPPMLDLQSVCWIMAAAVAAPLLAGIAVATGDAPAEGRPTCQRAAAGVPGAADHHDHSR